MNLFTKINVNVNRITSMSVLLILFIMLISATAFAQKSTVVVGAVGEDPKPGLRKALETQIKEAFVKDGRYTAVTREEAVLTAVDNEQIHQRSGAVDDAEVRQIGKQSGAKYVCVVEIAPLMNSYTLSAQFVDIESANIISMASVTNMLRNPNDFLAASEELVRKLLGYEQKPAADKKAPVKYVAVIETRLDTLSIPANEVSRSDLMEVTTVLRREAVKNLPRDKYNVMTSETVQSMGAAMVEDCAEENCIVTIGSKIGADYVVRGILSKLRGRYSLAVEIFETEYGNLVAVTPEPIRSADIDELIDKTPAGSAAMYKNFAGTGAQAAAPQSSAISTPSVSTSTTVASGAAHGSYTLTVAADPPEGGKVSYSPYSPRYGAGATVVVTATPTKGYKFVGWSLGTSETIMSANRRESIMVNDDMALSAKFNKINFKYDHYFSVKWMPPITEETACGWAFDLEYGQVRSGGWGDGWFWSIDGGGGDDAHSYDGDGDRDRWIIGGSFNMGIVHELTKNTHIAYGGSVGFWGARDWDTGYYDGHDIFLYGLAGPLVRLRYKFFEVKYRGLIGTRSEENNYCYLYNENGYNTIGCDVNSSAGIGYISQLMVGFHFATNRRQR